MSEPVHRSPNRVSACGADTVTTEPDPARRFSVVPGGRDGEYRAALREWWSALDAWNAAGEPLTGSVYYRLDAARDRFMGACNARSAHRGDET